MPEMSGLELIAELRELGLGTPAIIISGEEPGVELLNAASSVGAAGVLPKPFQLQELSRAVDKALLSRSGLVA